MRRERLKNALRGVPSLLASLLSVSSCQTEAPKPIPSGEYTARLVVQVFCDGGTNHIHGSPLDEPVQIPNDNCRVGGSDEDAWPGGGPPDSSIVELELHNASTAPITLTGIAFETDPSQTHELDELLEFRETSQECLEWLSKPPTSNPPGTTWHAPKTLQPNQRCYAVIGPVAPLQTPTTTGSVVIYGQGSVELARVPISVGH